MFGLEQQSDYNSGGTLSSFSDATSNGESHDPLGIRVDMIHIDTQTNKGCIEGSFRIYFEGKRENKHCNIARPITQERYAFTGILHIFPAFMHSSSSAGVNGWLKIKGDPISRWYVSSMHHTWLQLLIHCHHNAFGLAASTAYYGATPLSGYF